MGTAYYGYQSLYDDDFTLELVTGWKKDIVLSYESVMRGFKNKIDYSCPIRFTASKSLIDDVADDAVIGMRKISRNAYSGVKRPNQFKVTAYFAYWWLRHKPASVHTQRGFKLENVRIERPEGMEDEEYDFECQKFAWQLKHINELTAVHYCLTSIFQFENTVCGKVSGTHVKLRNGDRFVFDDFEAMRIELTDKLIYYFAYRPITPKVIEHILEAYTLHPAWKLTGKLWATSTNEENETEGSSLGRDSQDEAISENGA